VILAKDAAQEKGHLEPGAGGAKGRRKLGPPHLQIYFHRGKGKKIIKKITRIDKKK